MRSIKGRLQYETRIYFTTKEGGIEVEESKLLPWL